MTRGTGRRLEGSGDSNRSGPQRRGWVVANRVWTAKYRARLAITPTTAAVIPVRAAEGMVAAQPLHIGGAQEDEQKAGHKGHPGGQQRPHQGCGPGGERVGVVVGTQEGHELDHHDEGAGGGLGQGQPADHLAG